MAVKPEAIGDVEEGEPRLPAETDDLGLTPDERAQWDEMQAAAKEQAPAEGEEAAPDAPEEPAKPEGEAKPDAKADAPVEGEEDGDDAPETPQAIDPKTGKPPQKQVNWNKHQRELKKRDDRLAAADAKLREESEARIKLGERLAILNEALTAPAPVDPAVAQQQAVAENPMLEPDIKVEDDALGAIAQLQRRNAYLQGQLQGTQEETQAEREDRSLKEDFQRDADIYSRTADGQHFGAAYQFLKDSRLTELAISLFDKDPTDPAQVFTQAEINKLVADFNSEEKWVVSNARRSGKSPSAAIMKLAKGRGFKPQAAAPAPASTAAAPAAQVPAVKNGNGGAPAPTTDAVAKIKAEAEAAAASRSLSDGGGAPPGEPLTPERLLKMTDKEFGDYVDRLPKEHLDALMGRPQMAR